MTWTRLDDRWTRDKVIRRLNHQARWHYLCMIQLCSQGGDYDGVLDLIDAERCSDATDPAATLGELIVAGLVKNLDGERVKVVRIDDHIPPPSVREAAEKTKVRVSRHRKHKNDDHTECLPDSCPALGGNATGNALHRDRDGTGRAVTGSTTPLRPDEEAMLSEVAADDRWAEVREAWGPEDAA
jgi:hypothetical protein